MKNQVWNIIKVIAIIISVIAGIVIIRNRIVFDKLNRNYIIILERETAETGEEKSIYNYYSESFLQLKVNDFISFELFKYLVEKKQFNVLQNIPGVLLKTREISALKQLTAKDFKDELNKDFIFIILEEFEDADIGEYELEDWVLLRSFRGHQVPDNILKKQDTETITRRLQRSIIERNIRAIVIQPELQKQMPGIVKQLEKQNYFKTFSLQRNTFKSNKILILLIIMGVITISLISLFDGFGIPEILFPIPWIGFFFLAILSNFSELAPKFYQVMALITACAYPSLIALLAVQKRYKYPFVQFILYSFISIFAGVFIYSILSGPEFILYAKRFRGVKISFIIPFFMLFFFTLSTHFEEIKKYFMSKSVFRIVIFGVIIIIFIALLRTMNMPILGKSTFELAVRNLLEDVFHTRPRFKEFLIGHPLLLIALYLKKKNQRNILWILFLFFGLLGQVSIVNSLCHITHPFLLPLKSILLSIVLGTILGMFGIFTMYIIFALFKNETKIRKDINNRLLR